METVAAISLRQSVDVMCTALKNGSDKEKARLGLQPRRASLDSHLLPTSIYA